MSSDILLLVGIVVALVVVVVVILVVGRRRSRSSYQATPELLDPDKKRILRLKAQAKILPAIPLFVQIVKRGDIPRQLEQADVAHEVTIEDIARMKLLLMLLFGIAGAVLGALLFNPVLILIFAVVGMVIGFLGPDSTVKQAAVVRQAKISRALPLALEVIGLAVERTSIDSGIAYYCQFFADQVLAQELGYANQRVVQLKERLDVAMSELLRKNRNDDLSFLVAAVGQATQVGGRDLKAMLQGQSTELRIKREQEVKARALRAPVLMTFPTMLNMMALLVILGSLAFLQIGQNK
jgi:pilus assembly protein TadC